MTKTMAKTMTKIKIYFVILPFFALNICVVYLKVMVVGVILSSTMSRAEGGFGGAKTTVDLQYPIKIR